MTVPTTRGDRLQQLPEITLNRGLHANFDSGHCAMEVVAWLAGEEHTDHPGCVSPVIGDFVRTWNDALPDDRRHILKPLLPGLVNTRDDADEQRAWMATDWLVRVHLPAWLRLAKLDAHATALADLRRLDNRQAAIEAQPKITAAWDAAWGAARAAAGDAAGDAARATAGAALEPTVRELQESALELLKAMCEIGR